MPHDRHCSFNSRMVSVNGSNENGKHVCYVFAFRNCQLSSKRYMSGLL
jgi:hypothetical protein